MPKTKAQKHQAVETGLESLKKSQTVILADFTGLPVNELNGFRKTLRAAGAALFLFLWTAFGMISNWGNAEKAQGAFMNLKNIFYGMAIMLGAWFVVNAIILTVTQKKVPVTDSSSVMAAAIFGKPWSNLDGICKDL